MVLLELKSEKQSFSNRVSLVIGAIDKIGLFPGILALIISLANFNSMEQDWVLAVAYAMPFLYLFGVYAHLLINRINRYIAIIEYVLQCKKPLTRQ